jgi:putative SOS response-associated peptidase YedK
MCGRYTLSAAAPELVEAFDVPTPDFELTARYNIAPGQRAPVVAEDRRGRRVGLLTWGLVPGWRDEPGKPLINARSESVMERPSFADAFEHRRCVVPADGFYEWQREGDAKLPHWIHPAGGGLLAFAGIWESWSRAGVEPRHTFAILTRPSIDEVARIHDRMPVVIPRDELDTWLDRETGGDAAHLLLSRAPVPGYSCRPVSTRVNRPQEDDAALIAPLGP